VISDGWNSVINLILMMTTVGILVGCFTCAIMILRRRHFAEDVRDEPLKCPECGYDLRATPHECPECGVIVAHRKKYLRSLSREWPANAIELDETAEPVREAVELLSTDNSYEADLLRQQLNARGVRCAVARTGAQYTDAYGTSTTVYFRICVPADDEAIAREYLCRAQGVPARLIPAAISGERRVVFL